MAHKELAFAAAILLAMLAEANAGPAANIALKHDGGSLIKVDYDYPGGYYVEPPYQSRGLADVPGDLIGGALGIVSGAIGGALYGSGYYDRPYYRPDYYGSSYYGGYEPGPEAACQRDFPAFDPTTGTYLTEDGAEFLCPYLER